MRLSARLPVLRGAQGLDGNTHGGERAGIVRLLMQRGRAGGRRGIGEVQVHAPDQSAGTVKGALKPKLQNGISSSISREGRAPPPPEAGAGAEP